MNAANKITKLIVESTVNQINAGFYARYGNEEITMNAEKMHELTREIERELIAELSEQ